MALRIEVLPAITTTPEPPERFLRALDDPTSVVCRKEHCGLYMVIDRQAYALMRHEVALAKRSGIEPPIQLARLIMECLNGHVEVWRAVEPVLARETHALLPDTVEEDQVERPCIRCHEEFMGRPHQMVCDGCKYRKPDKRAARVLAPDEYRNRTGMRTLSTEERAISRELWKQKFVGVKQQDPPRPLVPPVS